MPIQYLRKLTGKHRNQDANRHLGFMLAFVAGAINAGGLIHVAHEIEGYVHEKAEKKTKDIYFTIEKIMARSEKENLATAIVARKMAKEILDQSK